MVKSEDGEIVSRFDVKAIFNGIFEGHPLPSPLVEHLKKLDENSYQVDQNKPEVP